MRVGSEFVQCNGGGAYNKVSMGGIIGVKCFSSLLAPENKEKLKHQTCKKRSKTDTILAYRGGERGDGRRSEEME